VNVVPGSYFSQLTIPTATTIGAPNSPLFGPVGNGAPGQVTLVGEVGGQNLVTIPAITDDSQEWAVNVGGLYRMTIFYPFSMSFATTQANSFPTMQLTVSNGATVIGHTQTTFSAGTVAAGSTIGTPGLSTVIFSQIAKGSNITFSLNLSNATGTNITQLFDQGCHLSWELISELTDSSFANYKRGVRRHPAMKICDQKSSETKTPNPPSTQNSNVQRVSSPLPEDHPLLNNTVSLDQLEQANTPESRRLLNYLRRPDRTN